MKNEIISIKNFCESNKYFVHKIKPKIEPFLSDNEILIIVFTVIVIGLLYFFWFTSFTRENIIKKSKRKKKNKIIEKYVLKLKKDKLISNLEYSYLINKIELSYDYEAKRHVIDEFLSKRDEIINRIINEPSKTNNFEKDLKTILNETKE